MHPVWGSDRDVGVMGDVVPVGTTKRRGVLGWAFGVWGISPSDPSMGEGSPGGRRELPGSALAVKVTRCLHLFPDSIDEWTNYGRRCCDLRRFGSPEEEGLSSHRSREIPSAISEHSMTMPPTAGQADNSSGRRWRSNFHNRKSGELCGGREPRRGCVAHSPSCLRRMGRLLDG